MSRGPHLHFLRSSICNLVPFSTFESRASDRTTPSRKSRNARDVTASKTKCCKFSLSQSHRWHPITTQIPCAPLTVSVKKLREPFTPVDSIFDKLRCPRGFTGAFPQTRGGVAHCPCFLHATEEDSRDKWHRRRKWDEVKEERPSRKEGCVKRR